MKRFIMFVFVLLLPTVVWSAPFLVCDPYTNPDAMPSEFVMTVNGVVKTVPYAMHPTTDAAIVVDLQPWVGQTIRIENIRACNEGGCSDPVPLFLVRGRPVSLNGIRLIP